MTDIRDFDERTLEAAKMVVRERFGERSCALLMRYLRNPLRSAVHHSAGDIVFRDGAPMAFQAANLRKLYLRQEQIIGINGSLFCKRANAKLKEVLATFLRTLGPRAERKIYFGNTAIPASAGVGSASNMSIGPVSCENVRFNIIRLGSFLNFILKGRLPEFIANIIDAIWLRGTRIFLWMKMEGCIKPVVSLDEIDIDGFWRRYIERNKGLVCSRTKEELQWIFGDNLRNGNVCMLAYIKDDSLLGYVVIKCQEVKTRCRWMVVDWIAIDDNSLVLDKLLNAVQCYLRNVHGASFVEIIGYPMFVQKIIRKSFPLCRKAPGNSFNYLIDDDSFMKKFVAVKDVSWFFGAYDGDRCM